jgi:hypothetical protein
MAVLTDLFYFPPLEYFVAILGHQEIWLDAESNYQKQTYRNRAQVRLANKIENLSIPIIGGNKKTKYAEVKIDYDQKWKNVHLRGIQSAYGKAPFYEFYFPYLEDVFDQNMTNLFEFNLEILTVCLRLLQMPTVLKIGLPDSLKGTEMDIRGIIHPKEQYSVRNIYDAYPYPQLFGVDFAPNLSILDLLLCAGPEAKTILEASQKK